MWKSVWLLGSLLCACGAAERPESSFLAALPSRQALEVLAPDGGATAATTAAVQPAQLYVLTRQTTTSVNGLVGGVLDTVASISQSPPSAVGPDTAAWGPMTESLSPVAWRLAISRVGPGQNAFEVDVRPKSGTDADFQPFLQGTSEGTGPDGPGGGTFSVDLDVAQQLDPVGNPNLGQVTASWNVQPGGHEVHVVLQGVHAASLAPTTADVVSVLFPDGSGALSFDAEATVLADGDVFQVTRVRSHWSASGAGRGDAEVHQVDGGAGAQYTECWNASFDTVYARATSGGDAGSEGDAAACVFANPLP